MKIIGYIIVSLVFHDEDGHWLGECSELGTATFGSTLQEAKEKLKEAVLLHLNTLEDVGERERFFKEHNIKCYIHKPHSTPLRVRTKNIFVQRHIQPIPALAGIS